MHAHVSAAHAALHVLLVVAPLAFSGSALACGRCLPVVYAVVYDGQFAATLGLLLLPLVLMAGAGLLVHHGHALAGWHRSRIRKSPPCPSTHP
jgi:hypothetical protein